MSSVGVEFDPARRILSTHFRGVVTPADARAYAEHVRDLLATVDPGFSMLTDLTGLEEMDIDSVGDITRVMDLCLAAGVQRIVRVIPDPSKDIGFHLLSLTHYRGRVPIATCETILQAEGVLGVG